jgi:hypothetical protein
MHLFIRIGFLIYLALCFSAFSIAKTPVKKVDKKHVLNTLFNNLDAKYSGTGHDFSHTCNENTIKCLIEKIPKACRPDKSNPGKPMPECSGVFEYTKNLAAWSDITCKQYPGKPYSEILEDRYPEDIAREIAKSIKSSGGDKIWECDYSWGVDPGTEAVWSLHLFLVFDHSGKFIRNSFFVVGTP